MSKIKYVSFLYYIFGLALFSIRPLQFTDNSRSTPPVSVNDSNSWKAVQMWGFVAVDNVTDS